MNYLKYYQDFKKHWPLIREIDDSLALSIEKAYPNHEHFSWMPHSETELEVTVHLPQGQVQILHLAVSEFKKR